MKFRLLLSVLWISPTVLQFAPASAAEFFVDSNLDARDALINGICSTAAGACSLRAALEEANASGTADIIHVPAETFSLTTTLEITDSDSIVGAGAALTIIEASASHRVFHIRATTGDVMISRVTIRNGNAGTGSDGGALYVDANASLWLTDTVITANRARDGGGIYSLGALTLVRTEIFGNTASDSDSALAEGGGVYSASAGADPLLMQDSYIHDNVAEVAGGVFVSGTATIERSTLAANRALNESGSGEGGGGIVHGGAGSSLLMVNVTLSGNRADGFGGGLVNRAGTANLFSVTIADNIADANNTGVAEAGGGIYVDTGTVNIESSILARNQSRATGADCRGTVTSGGYNIVGTNAGCTFVLQTSDRTDANFSLDDLRANGGFAPTRALSGGSPAVDPTGHSTCSDGSAPLLVDQRGSTRPVNRLCDIGAYEASGVTASAGSDQTVRPTEHVTLDGRASTVATGTIRAYAWQQVGGPEVTLSNANSAVATFTAPASATTLVFRLTVTDSNDVFHSDETSVIVTIDTPVGQHPGGIAGPGQVGSGTGGGGYGGGGNGGCALGRPGFGVDLIWPLMLLAAVIGIHRRTERNAA